MPNRGSETFWHLGGDPPRGTVYDKSSDSFQHAVDLVSSSASSTNQACIRIHAGSVLA